NTPARMFLAQIAGDALRTEASGVSVFDADAEALTTLVFQASAPESPGEVDADTPVEREGQDAVRDLAATVRLREQQIQRISQDLSSYAQLAAAFGEDLGATPRVAD